MIQLLVDHRNNHSQVEGLMPPFALYQFLYIQLNSDCYIINNFLLEGGGKEGATKTKKHTQKFITGGAEEGGAKLT